MPCRVPVIVNVYDGYQFGANTWDLAVDVEAVFPLLCGMSWCHQSQVTEWLPWVGRHHMAAPQSAEEWAATLRARFDRKNRELGLPGPSAMEVFTVTAWGEVPTRARLEADWGGLLASCSQLDRLGRRLAVWRGET